MKIRVRLREESGIYFPEYLRFPWSRKWKPFVFTLNSDIHPRVYIRKFMTREEGEEFLNRKRELGFWRFRYYDCE